MVAPRIAARLSQRLAVEQSSCRLPSIVAGLIRDGELVWSGGCGRVDGVTPGADVQYRCGSITKTFIGVAVMRLRDEGLLALGDTVQRFLPDTGIGELTVAQLLSHSSGLRAETGAGWWERTRGGDLAQLSDDTLRGGTRFDPARRFHYSNVGFAVLGGIVAAVRGTAWEIVVAEELLRPLGMTRTTTRPQPPAAPGLAVHPWADVVLPEPEHDAGAMAPAGQLWTTVTDLGRWAAFIAGDGSGLLTPETLAEMREPRVVNDVRGAGWTVGYGLGLQVWNEAGACRFGHSGSMPGFLADLQITDSGDAVVAFANATSGMSGALGPDLLKILAEEEPRLPDEWVPVTLPAVRLSCSGCGTGARRRTSWPPRAISWSCGPRSAQAANHASAPPGPTHGSAWTATTPGSRCTPCAAPTARCRIWTLGRSSSPARHMIRTRPSREASTPAAGTPDHRSE